ncbi:hypothetical protein G7043_41300 [Lentzea sp. NEAU-D13]|uniref:Secreted protein n=1 Tax=Lentzea alba TaxID=2714351 RepID=A0A7C9RXN9_9PSEU|nr:hypothetical protein [Lentzea alba]NGY65350.1 hypothetical protein [Lentzea alba]
MDGKRKRTSVRSAVLVLLTAAFGGALVAGAAPASASGPGVLASYIDSNSGGANLRTCGTTACGVIAYMGNGTGVTMQCWTDSQWVHPPASDYSSPRWFRLSTPWGVGYTHSSLVEGQTSVGKC